MRRLALRGRGAAGAGLIAAALAVVAACKSDDNDPCPSGRCGPSDAGGGDATTPGKSCKGAADCAPTEQCSFSKSACGGEGVCATVIGCGVPDSYACGCDGAVVRITCTGAVAPTVGASSTDPKTLPCTPKDGGADGSDAQADAAADAGDGSACPPPSCTIGGTGGCICTRPGSTPAYALDCDGTTCQCTKGGASLGAPFSQAAESACSSVAQAAFVMDKNCGACP